ncbi:MAG: hypothetical protein ACM3SY_05635 [Candidatus Omnitrophota bacterium]
MATIAEQWMKEGMEKGIEKAKQEVILNSLHAGLSIDLISEITGISIEKIQEFLEQRRIQSMGTAA